MKYFLDAAKLLLLDLASTLLFLILYLATKNLAVSVATAMALGLAQIGWQFLRKKPIDTMQWLSLFLVLGAGAATLITNDPHFVMLKPTVIYTVVGIVMLKPGWMNRYLPPIAMEVVPDVAVLFGFIWAAPMFFSATSVGGLFHFGPAGDVACWPEAAVAECLHAVEVEHAPSPVNALLDFHAAIPGC